MGRTLPIWNSFARSGPFTPDAPWLLRFFDQVRFYLVSEDELMDQRAKFASGQMNISITDSTFDVAAHDAMVAGLTEEIAPFKAQQRAAMDVQLRAEADSLAELEAAGQGPQSNKPAVAGEDDEDDGRAYDAPHFIKVSAAFSANVWEIRVKPGDSVKKGDTLVVLEAMKMETPVHACVSGTVVVVKAKHMQVCPSGALLVVIDTRTPQ